jgi:hypothetical protein
MAVALTSLTGGMFARLGGRAFRLTLIILGAAILIGGGLALWARLQLNAVLEIRGNAEIAIALEAFSGDCGTPALYVLPIPAGVGTDYRVVLDFLGGPNRFPELGGASATSVLMLPESRRPGVGLGRGLLDSCDSMTISIVGGFTNVQAKEAGAATLDSPGPGVLRLSYARPPEPSDAAALSTFVLRQVADAWQFGHKRVRFANAGGYGVNVFLYEEPDFLFLNENFSLVRPPNVRRSYVDVHLEMMGGMYASTADVVRRRPTSDLELQNRLIDLSTLFGIGISLLVEGVLILLVSVAAAVTTGRPGEPAAEPSTEEGESAS